MANDYLPLPSGGSSTTVKMRRTPRGTGTTKEKKRKKDRRPKVDERITEDMPRMLNTLCQEMYENELHDVFESRKAFCDDYAEHVVDRRLVKHAPGRSKVVDDLLSIAEAEGRIEIVSRGRGFSRGRVSIVLSDAESQLQRMNAKARGTKSEQRWQERRSRKAEQHSYAAAS